jgi:hypothetical protein
LTVAFTIWVLVTANMNAVFIACIWLTLLSTGRIFVFLWENMLLRHVIVRSSWEAIGVAQVISFAIKVSALNWTFFVPVSISTVSFAIWVRLTDMDAIIVAKVCLGQFSAGSPDVIIWELMITRTSFRTTLIATFISCIAVFIRSHGIVSIFASLWLVPSETHTRRFSAAIFSVVCAYVSSAALWLR